MAVGRGAPLDGSSPAQTPEFARRTADAGLLCILSFAMPLRADREALRDSVGRGRFFEVYASASLENCKKRDRRGLYGPNHPDPSYEKPQAADIELDLSALDAKTAANQVVLELSKRGLI